MRREGDDKEEEGNTKQEKKEVNKKERGRIRKKGEKKE